MYRLSRTVQVNEPASPYLSRHDVWSGLLMKANNALLYVPIMQKCEVIGRGDGWLIRDIVLNNVPLRERVTFEPETRVVFDRIDCSEMGRIENIIGEDEQGALTLTFSFALTKAGIPSGSAEESRHFSPMEGAYLDAVASTLAAVRRTAEEKGRENIPLSHPRDAEGDNGWIFDFLRAIDSMDLDRLLALHTDDVQLTVANHPPLHGRGAMSATIAEWWTDIKAMSHSVSGAWSLHGGAVGIAETTCMYTRHDNSTYTVRRCTTLRRRDGKIFEVRIHAEMMQ